MCRYVHLYCSVYIHWFFHKNKSQAMLLPEAEHYHLFTLSQLCLSFNIFPPELRWVLWKGRHFYAISIHMSLLQSFLSLCPFPVAFLYHLSLLFIHSNLKICVSIFKTTGQHFLKPSSCPDRDISALPDVPEIRLPDVPETDEYMPPWGVWITSYRKKMHTISQSVSNSQVYV